MTSVAVDAHRLHRWGRDKSRDDHDLDDGLVLRPTDPPVAGLKQASLPIDVPTPEFGRPLDAPKGRAAAKLTKASPVDEDKVGDYRHAAATRTNIPEAGQHHLS